MKLIIHVDTFEGEVHNRTPYDIELTPEQVKFIKDKLKGDSVLTGTFLVDEE